MKEKPGLKNLLENLDQLEGLDTNNYEIEPVDTVHTGEYDEERLYHVSAKMGEERLPSEGKVDLRLGYDKTATGERLTVSFEPFEDHQERNLLTVPFRQLLEENYVTDLDEYNHLPEDQRQITVERETGEWFSEIPETLENRGLDYKEFADGITFEEDQKYVIAFRNSTPNRVELMKMIDNQKFKQERETIGFAENTGELENMLEEVK